MARETIEFVKAALRRPLEVSTVFPTSRALAETLLSFADLENSRRVVELGAGTGAITRHILPRLGHPTSYLGIELDLPMVDFLKSEFPQLRFASGPAEDLGQWVQPRSVDVIVSSLPWTVFSNDTQERTVTAILQALKPGGMFLTYLCANAIWYPQARSFIQRLEQEFSSCRKSHLEWRNIPPAYVFRSIR